MQNKESRKPLYLLIALLVVLAGMLSYMLSKPTELKGFIEASLIDVCLGTRSAFVDGDTGTGEDEAEELESLASFVELCASKAADDLSEAETAFDDYDAAGLASAQEDAEAHAEQAEWDYEDMEAYVEDIKTTREAAKTAYDEAKDTAEQAASDFTNAKATLTGLEATLNATQLYTITGEEWSDLFDADDDYTACDDDPATPFDDECSDEEETYEDLYEEACIAYYGTWCSSIGNFPTDYEDAKDAYDAWAAQYAAVYMPLGYESRAESYGAIADAYQELYQNEQTYYSDATYLQDEAAEDSAAARSSADEAAAYTFLTCESLTLDPSSYEMAATDTEASFDLTVNPTLSETDASAVRMKGIQASLLGLVSGFATTPFTTGDDIEFGGIGELLGGGSTEAWQGTLVFETNGDGSFTYGGTNDYDDTNPQSLEVTATETDESVRVNFSGGVAQDVIAVSVYGEETLCDTSFTITQASEGSVEPSTSTDTDGDGLTNKAELLLGSDPDLADTDGDGTSDGDEVDAGTDPLVDETTDLGSIDTDGDGLTDDEEVALGTDFRTADTDGDGYDDGEEVTEGTDPSDDTSYPTEEVVDDDADDDGLTDDEEAALGTDSSTSDTDSDGLSDYEESVTYLTDPLTADSDDDGDEDGTEVSAGTDPLDSSDYTVTTSGEVPTLTRDIILSTDYTCTHSFLDIVDEWHEDIICRAKEAAWVKGYATTVFGPDGDITRAEWTKVLTKIFGMDEEDISGLSTDFLDVSSSDWFYPYVLLAEDADTIRTRDNGYYFNPNEPITRADAILWAIRMAGQSTYSYDIEPIFSDVENEDYFAYAVWIANSTEVDTADDTDQPIVEGYSDGTFGPYKNIARSEAMAIATRVAIAWGVASEDWDE